MTFLDTNICLDLIAKRSPWHKDAEILVKTHVTGAQRMGISVLTIPTLAFLLEKYQQSVTIDTAMKNILQLFEILDVTGDMVKQAIDNNWKDLEDAIQHECATQHKAECIITRNKKDFKESEIPVLTPTEWLQLFKE